MDKQLNFLYQQIKEGKISTALAKEQLKAWKSRYREDNGIAGLKPEIYVYDEPFLKDHQVNGEQVLLGVTSASLAINTFFRLFPDERQVQLHHLSFIKPFIIKKTQQLEITVLPVLQKDRADIQVSGRYNTTVPWAPLAAVQICKTVFKQEHKNITEIMAGMQLLPDFTYIYDVDPGIQLGESYRVIAALYANENQVLAKVELRNESEEHFYDLHPLLINSAFLAITPLLQEKEQTAYLPFGIKDIYFSKQEQLKSGWVLAKLVKDSGEMFLFDATLMDDSGEVLAVYNGCAMKKIRPVSPVINDMPAAADPADRIQEYLVNRLSKMVSREVLLARPETNLMDLGLTSEQLVAMTEEIAVAANLELYPTLFFEYPNLLELTAYFCKEHPSIFTTDMPHPVTGIQDIPVREAAPQFSNTATNDKQQNIEKDDIAIIGMHGIFAGAENLDQFWEHLRDGKDLVGEIPLDHWDYRPWFDEDREAKDKTYCRWGSFISNVDKFDAGFFNISPREADWMDPQLRLLLQSVYTTTENAGYINRLRGTDTGVFVGVCCHDYKDLIAEMQLPVDPYIGTGNTQPMMANRISFLFDITGPSMAIDTACSSSLFALHSACQALRNKECGMAFVSGVNLLLSSTHYRYFSSIGALSASGHCHSFDNKADGYVPGEAIATILLKPLQEAERDGDHIYAVIKGSAALHGGYTPSLTAPSIAGEENVILKAWASAGIAPETLGYIEAHGTGTRLGDPIEINSLKKAFKRFTGKEHFCAVGSVKSNIGHTEGAAGIAGILKVVQQLRHRQIPAMPHFKELNSYIQLDNSPLYINRQLEEWKSPDGMPRRAGVSSFGIAGAYAHVVVEEYNQPQKTLPPVTGQPVIIALSAKRTDSLQTKVLQLLQYIRHQQFNDQHLPGIGATLQLYREEMDERIAFSVSSISALIEKLTVIATGKEWPSGIYSGRSLKRISKEESMREWISKGVYDELAGFWVNGGYVDWRLLYNGHAPQKIMLPSYPFAGERYWIPLEDARTSNNSSHTVLHPLVQQNTSGLSGLRFSATFNGTEFFIADHVVSGQKILPGVAHFEMARAAIALAIHAKENEYNISLRNVVWIQPVLAAKEPVTIHIRLFPEDASRIAFEIYSEPDAGKEDVIIHSQGHAIIQSAVNLPSLDIEVALQQCSQRMLTAEDCYSRLQGIGFFHGKSYQAVQKVYVGETTALGELALPEMVADSLLAFVLHPVMMDAALTPALGLMMAPGSNNSLRLALPFALDELEVCGRCTSAMWTLISSGSAPEDQVQKLDVLLYDDKGNLCVSMKGLSFRATENGTTSVLPEATGTLLLEPQWVEQVVSSQTNTANGFAAHHVIFCEKEMMLPEYIMQRMPGVSCISLFADEQQPAARFENYAQQLLLQIQGILKSEEKDNVLLQVVTGVEDEQLLLSGLSGLLMTAQLEHPGFTGQLLATSAKEPDEMVVQLRDSSHQLTYSHIRYINGKRLVKEWCEINVPEEAIQLPWKNGGVYLITGGGGGLGQLFAEEIARNAKEVVLVFAGRSAPEHTIKSQVEAFSTEHTTMIRKKADVSNLQEVTALINDLLSAYGRLDGILHMAGVIRDNYLISKTTTVLQEVFAPKVAGVVNLDIATRALPLDFFVCFSSGAVITGNAGQADYTAANYFMDTYAAYRKQLVAVKHRSGITLSVNWPLWEAGGMKVDEATRHLMTQSTGMIPMHTKSGIRALYQCMASGRGQVMVMEGNVPLMKAGIAALTQHNPTSVQQTISHGEDPLLKTKLMEVLQKLTADIIRRNAGGLDVMKPLSSYGFDSITFTELANKLNQQFKLRLTPTIFFEHASLQQLTEYLIQRYTEQLNMYFGITAKRTTVPDPVKAKPANASWQYASRDTIKPQVASTGPYENPTPDQVAVIGMSGRFPMAADLTQFWNNLLEGKDCITEIPESRWDWKAYYGDPRKEVNKTNVKWGGFIDGIDEFDPLFFGISPKEAEMMDPQQRLLMMYVWKVLEDAGYASHYFAGTQTAIFAGTMGSSYSSLVAGSNAAIEGFSSTGMVASVGPNRMSYFLDLHGPSEPVETACSSSLVAIHRAVECINNGSCDMAIAGGINTIVTPEAHISFNKAGMLSEDGRCKTFSAEANGYVRGEGVGMLLLKRLSAAEADGDHIYGVIRATAENHGGRANSLTSPNPVAQAALLKKVYTKAGIDPATVNYIETHGTGTVLGDPIEINALKSAFKTLYEAAGSRDVNTAHCGLGTVKSNIGHLELAAGVAGVMKVLLQLQHKTLVKSLHCDNINPYIELSDSPFYIVQQSQPWQALQDSNGRLLPRRAGVSSFGFGGVNAHIVIEEYIPHTTSKFVAVHPAIIVLSALTTEGLKQQAVLLLSAIQQGHLEKADLPAIACTLQTGRDAMKERLGFVARSIAEVVEKLQDFIDDNNDTAVYRGQSKSSREALAVFTADEELQEAVDKWIQRGKYDKLLDLWVKGLSFDWNRLYENGRPRRISLPTYPFARESYWITAATPSSVVAPSTPSQQLTAEVQVSNLPDELYLRKLITQLLSDSLKVNAAKIDADDSFADYGLDSVTGVHLVQLLNDHLSLSLETTILFDYSSVNRLAGYIYTACKPVRIPSRVTTATAVPHPLSGAGDNTVPASAGQQKGQSHDSREPVAIIGMSGRFAGANNIEELWKHLSNGTNLVEKVTRWDLAAYATDDQTFCNHGSFLDDIAAFDPLFFNISGNEAAYMDPQQRLFLQEAWKALEDAGYAGKSEDGRLCGVYAGCGAGDYQQLFRNNEQIPAQAFWGNMSSVIPARIAYYLNLQGPAVSIDTACSSSLVAVHLACQGLWEHETTMALAGGVFVQSTPWLYASAGKAGMLSPTGTCYTFDDRANGFVPGEGVGVVVLKRLSEALADGDHIYGVIRGSGINQDGTTNGITAPSAVSQERLESSIYERFDIDPANIQLVEAHGTGTKLGDPIEFNALSRAFRKYTDKQYFCAIGSVKTNIGHTQLAAGIAGLFKVLLSLQHRQIPPSLHYEKGNTNISFDESPFFVNTDLKEWPATGDRPRCAATSSFGASGTNAHMVIEEAPQVVRTHVMKPGYIVLLSARTPHQLQQIARRLSSFCDDAPGADLGNISYTLLMGRKHFTHRLAVVAKDTNELATALKNWLDNGKAPQVYSAGQITEDQESLKKYGEECIQYCSSNNSNNVEFLERLAVVAGLYVQGYTLLYENLYAGDTYSRISLPTYPFSTERYWVPAFVSAPVITPVQKQQLAQEAHGTSDVAYELMTFEEVWEAVDLIATTNIKDKIWVCMLEETAQQHMSATAYAGVTLVFIAPGSSYEKYAAHHYRINAAEKGTYERALNDITATVGKIDGVLYGWPLTTTVFVEDSSPVLFLLQALSACKVKDVRVLLTGLYHNGIERCHIESWMGIERSLGMILPQIQMAVVFGEAGHIALSQWLLICRDELQAAVLKSAHYQQGRREVCKIHPVIIENNPDSMIRAGGTYLITGGCGGLGILFARHFAGLHPVNLILTGRTPLDAAKQASVKALEDLGSKVWYVQADICDEMSMQEALQPVLLHSGPVNGVIHAAGISTDKGVLEKSPADFQQVLAPKVTGVMVLDKLLQDQSPDFVCYFSSSSGIMGDFGSCDYAMANRFLITYARYRSSLSLPGKTAVINWPLWNGEGMKVGGDDTTKMYLKSSGLRLMEATEGIDLFKKLLLQSRTQHLVITGQPARVHRFLGLTAVDKKEAATVVMDAGEKKVMARRAGISLPDCIEQDLKQLAAGLLQIGAENLYIKDNLADFGFDSISLAQFAQLLASHYQLDITPALFFGYSTLEKLTQYFATAHTDMMETFYGEEEPVIATSAVTASSAVLPAASPVTENMQEPIAIIGMSGRFPQARNIDEMWDIMVQGKHAVEEIPAERFDWRLYYDGPQPQPGKTNCKWCGCIPGVAEFDPLFFEISPGEAETMDPRQRLLLQESWRALEDAGYLTAQLNTGKIGMFVGVEEGDYQMLTREKSTITSNHNAILASRLAYFLNLNGPVMAINTACSSGLVAVHQACMSLRTGECDAALAAGVNLVLVPEAFIWMGQAGMLSDDGKCAVFDRQANGLVPGEAVAAVVLKRLSRAIADGDPVYAVIKGSGINYDGKTNGITAPSGVAQTALLKDVYDRYQIIPEDISYLVTHGTGTRLGDPVEVNALYDAFRSYTQKQAFCALTSTKTNFGHTMAASGLVSLISLVQALRHETIPASLHCVQESDYIKWKESPFYVNKTSRHWEQTNGLRTGALSAFGFSGTNAHMVLQSYASPAVVNREAPYYMVVLSAKTEDALRNKIRDMVVFLEQPETAASSLSAITYTLLEGRQHFACRCAVVVANRQEAVHGWKQAGRNERLPFVFTGKVPRDFRMQTALQQYATQLLQNSQSLHNQPGKYQETLFALAELYCQGYELPWPLLYGDVLPQRVHLPTYPFAQEYYWVTPAVVTAQVSATAERVTETDTLFLQPYWKEQAAESAVTVPEYEQHLVISCIPEGIHAKEITARIQEVQYICLAGSITETDKRFQQQAAQLFTTVQSLLNSKPRKKILVQLQIGDQPEEQLSAGLAGILKTARLENPLFYGQLIRTSSAITDPEILINQLLECARNPLDTDVRYKDGKREVAGWKEMTMPESTPALPWKEGGVYLITGGAGGLGWIFAEEMAVVSKGITLVLCGRSALSGEQEQRITALAARGVKVLYKQADVSDLQQADKLILDIQSLCGRLDGIIHSAGLIRDNYIFKKTTAELLQVLSPKVSGLLHIDEASKHLPLDFIVAFSSGAGVMGNAGQADYAAANAFMDAYARYRDELVREGKRSGKTLAISWPLWEEGGMAVDDATRNTILQKAGMIPLRRQTGIAAFYKSLQYAQTHVMIWEGYPTTMRAFLQDAGTADKKRIPVPVIPAAASSQLRRKTTHQLKLLLAEDIKLDISRIDAAAPLEIYGIDSFIITRLNQKLAVIFGELSKTLFFEYQTLDALADYFVTDHVQVCMEWTGLTAATVAENITTTTASDDSQNTFHITAPLSPAPVAHAPQDGPEPIAIIGLSGRYPQAATLEEYWNNLATGKDCITEIPADRWPVDGFFNPDEAAAIEQGKSYSKWGGFLEGFADFDPKFFNISPREAINMDPQERLFIQACWEVLEDAGYTREQLALKYKHRVGVFAGITKTGFDLYGPELWKAGKPFYPHTSFSSVANRVSYLFNLQGPSMPIDTMCSSSLTAIHEACGHLRLRECELAIAGGVNLYVHPSGYIGLCAQRMLSADGQCKSFGAGGNGFVPGEGVGAVLLKRLSAAIADNDHIYGVIRSSGINHGGKTNGYTVPNPVLQGMLIRETMDKAGIDAGTISYIEAHGTGTELGDPIEITGLTQAFRHHTQDQQFCAIGAVKSNIGHLEAAAGIAGITKVLLQMKHGKIAPSLHAAVLNPNINFGRTPFIVQQELKEWKRLVVHTNGVETTLPRRAGISSFGAGGTNAHVIIEEYISGQQQKNTTASLPVIILLSARNANRLIEMAGRLLAFVRQAIPDETMLADIAYTLQVGREAMEERLAFTVNNLQELEEKLVLFTGNVENTGEFYRGQIKDGKSTLSDLSVEDALQPAIEQWMQQKKYTRLMELWIKGFVIDWNRLYTDVKRGLISLPAYPFARERYWSPDNLLKVAATAHTPVAPITQPLQAEAVVQQGLQPLTTTVVAENIMRDKPTGIVLRGVAQAIVATTHVTAPPVVAPSVMPAAVITTTISNKQLRRELTASLAEALFMQVEDVDEEKNLVDIGLDSIVGVEWVRAVNKKYGTAVAALRVYDYPTILLFAAFMENELKQLEKPAVAGNDPSLFSLPPEEQPVKVEKNIPAAATISLPTVSTRDLQQGLVISLAEALFMLPEEVATDKNFVDMGLDSIVGVEWTRAINKQYGTALPATKLYDYPTIEELARYLAKVLQDSQAGEQAAVTLSMDDILLKVKNGHLDVGQADQLLNHLFVN
ncbi:acyl transferase domain-containing protein [Chitinophaga niastensis]|uniref:Acyl transferase domain-containing protein n=2 Tax=Chitinophaga niastensis TaxID=536980 RepID=A0A2P8HPR0_CHINA|nr:acyl transferase domain-containing protein [Chitinophaga niastensis]